MYNGGGSRGSGCWRRKREEEDEEEWNSLASAAGTSDWPCGHSYSSIVKATRLSCPIVFVEAALKILNLPLPHRLPLVSSSAAYFTRRHPLVFTFYLIITLLVVIHLYDFPSTQPCCSSPPPSSASGADWRRKRG